MNKKYWLIIILLVTVLFYISASKGCFLLPTNEGSVSSGSSAKPTPPAQVTSPNPPDGATDVSINIILTWALVTGATSYDVYFINGFLPVTNTTNTSYNPGMLSYNTTYYWRIDSKNSAGTTTGQVWSFTTVVAPPPQVTTPNPSNGATGVSINPTLSWASASGATSYDVYFGITTTGWSPVTNTTATTYNPGTLLINTTYYWRIDSKNSAVTTTGVVWSFTTQIAPPAQVTSPNPANGATNVITTTQLSWASAAGATSYDVYFGTTSPGAFVGNQSGTSYNPGTLNYSTTYYWRIDSKNSAGTTTGQVWNFTTEAQPVSPPAQVTSPNPANGATGVITTTQLSWALASGATSYDVFFATFAPPPLVNTAQSETSFNPGTLNYNTIYYWRVNSKNSAGTTTGVVWSFTTVVAPPPQVTTPNPSNGATSVSINSTLSWASASGATSYDVYFGTTSPGLFAGNQSGTTYNPSTLAISTTYYWRIDSKNTTVTTTGVVWSFTTVVAPPPQVTTPNPSNGATSVSISTLSWAPASGATSYDVYFGITTTGWSPVTNTTATTYNPEMLLTNTTYYWQVDSKNSTGTTTGDIWSFTTGPWVCSTLDSTGNVGNYTSIAIDSGNKVHISYYDWTNYNLKYATNVSGSWVYSILDSFGEVGYYTSIAIDSNNKVHIGYRDSNNYDLKYATNASGSWVCSTIDSVGYVGDYTSIVVDSNNKAHISYYDDTNADLKYATNASGDWVCSTLDSTSAVGSSTAIAIDFNNKVHISYYGGDTIGLKYATNASGDWVYSTLDSAGNVGWYTSIALDSNNKVHISYHDATNSDLKYATNATGSWVYATIDSTGNVGYPTTSIAIDSNNKVHISYYDYTNGDLKYATNVSGSWVYSTLDSVGNVGNYTSIAIDSNNKVHISYYDATNGDLKYATNK